jgi:hypothetical protein
VSFSNTTDFLAGVLLQGDLDLYAALRLYHKIICDYAYRLGHWEAGDVWKLTIPISAGLGVGGGSGSIGPITWSRIPVHSIATAIRPPTTGLNCLSWDEIKRFLCDNGILPPSQCAPSGPAPGPGMAPLENCEANANLGEVADSFISRCRKASIRREFPGEMLDRTLGEIKKGKTAAHKKAWKLFKRQPVQENREYDPWMPSRRPLPRCRMFAVVVFETASDAAGYIPFSRSAFC